VLHHAQRLVASLRRLVGRERSRVHGLTTRRGLVTVQTRVANRERQVAELAHTLGRTMNGGVDRWVRRVRDLDRRLDAVDQRRRLANLRTRLGAAEARLGQNARDVSHRSEVRLGSLAGRLGNLSPLNVLARGYAVCFAGDQQTIIRDAAQVESGASVHVRVERGTLDCVVTRTATGDGISGASSTDEDARQRQT